MEYVAKLLGERSHKLAAKSGKSAKSASASENTPVCLCFIGLETLPSTEAILAARDDTILLRTEDEILDGLLILQQTCPVHLPRVTSKTDFRRTAQRMAESAVKLEFLWNEEASVSLMQRAHAAGFLVMGYERKATFMDDTIQAVITMFKLHEERSVICNIVKQLQVSKTEIRQAKKFLFSVDLAFEDVLSGCIEYHGSQNWIHPGIQATWLDWHAIGRRRDRLTDADQKNLGETLQSPATIDMDNSLPISPNLPRSESALPALSQGECPKPKKAKSEVLATARLSPSFSSQNFPLECRILSVEVWDANTVELVAGEIGVLAGDAIYTSLTGYHNVSGSGSVQLACLGRWLAKHGVTMWDFGMDMAYKTARGCEHLPRAEFVKVFNQLLNWPAGSLPAQSTSTSRLADMVAPPDLRETIANRCCAKLRSLVTPAKLPAQQLLKETRSIAFSSTKL